MAAPQDKTLSTLDGRWVLNKTLSDSVDPVLALQGFGWVLRMGLAAASQTLVFKVTDDVPPEGGTEATADEPEFEPRVPATEDGKVPIFHFDQLVSGGFKGSAETRYLDGLVREHTDWLFGTVRGQSMHKTHEAILALPDEYLAGKEAERGPWLDEGNHVWSYVKSTTAGWDATQVWGFQNVLVDDVEERRFCRNVVVTAGEDRAAIRLVYDYEEPVEEPAEGEGEAEPAPASSSWW